MGWLAFVEVYIDSLAKNKNNPSPNKERNKEETQDWPTLTLLSIRGKEQKNLPSFQSSVFIAAIHKVEL